MTTFGKIIHFSVFILILNLTNCFVSLFPEGGFSSSSQDLEEKVITGKDKDKIALISIEGVISDDKKENFFGFSQESPISLIKESLKKAEKDPDVKALILKINSPGGTVTASDIIHNEIIQFKKRKNIPVMTIFMDVGASGAYYIAMSSDIVGAHPTTVTGSIGVVLQGINVREGLEKIGVYDQSITSGGNKSIGSPLKELTPEQKRILQSVVDSLYNRFFEVVKDGRPGFKGKEASLKALCDGRIFTADQAKSLGLIDMVGYFEDFVPALMKHKKYQNSGNNNFPKIVTYVRGKSKVDNLYQANSDIYKENILNKIMYPSSSAKFYYLWSL
jgi:protease IV